MANTLHHSPAQVLSKVLVAMGLGVDPDVTAATASNWPIYYSDEPSDPDNVITVYSTEGTSDGRLMPTGEAAGHEGIQVRVRAVTHSVGYLKANEIHTALSKQLELENATLDAATYIIYCAAQLSRVIPLGRESPTSKRHLFTINCLLAIQER